MDTLPNLCTRAEYARSFLDSSTSCLRLGESLGLALVDTATDALACTAVLSLLAFIIWRVAVYLQLDMDTGMDMLALLAADGMVALAGMLGIKRGEEPASAAVARKARKVWRRNGRLRR